MYSYINIRKDFEYSQSISVGLITQVLTSCSKLIAEDERHYKNTEEYPWTRVAIINCDDKGNYPAGLDQNTGVANLVGIVFSSKGNVESQYQGIALANKIAVGLSWEAVNTDTNDMICEKL